MKPSLISMRLAVEVPLSGAEMRRMKPAEVKKEIAFIAKNRLRGSIETKIAASVHPPIIIASLVARTTPLAT